FIGRISYSLYLWHWPLLVFAEKYLSPGTLGPSLRALVLVGAFVAAYASWRWVEQPFRVHRDTSRRWPALVTAAASVVIFSVAGWLVVASNGWASRFPGIESVSLERQTLESADPDWARFDEHGCFVAQASQWRGSACFLSHHSPTNALLWGDSFAAAHAYGVFHSAHPNMNVLQYTSPQCPPIFGYDAASRPECEKFSKRIVAILRENNIATVILAANWSAYIKRRKLEYADIGATAARLRAMHVRVILVGQSPVFPFAYPDEYFFRTFGADGRAGDYYAPQDLDPTINRRIAQAVGTNVDVFFDPLKLLCRESACLFRQDRSYLFLDYGHYSLYGSEIVAGALLHAADPGVSAADRPARAEAVANPFTS
ncbi:MAG TPA: acyltransferase family protein, partial [Steroidobacteraceae bacterium]